MEEEERMKKLMLATPLFVVFLLRAHGVPWIWATSPLWGPIMLASAALLLVVTFDLTWQRARRRRGAL